MTDDAGQPVVADAPDRNRYEISLDGEPAGFVAYLDRDGQRIFYHTEIDERFGGKGLAGILVAHALGESRDAGRRIVPVCPYVARWVTNHHDVDDALDPVGPEALAAVRAVTG
ncbi:MAG: N-acetyltransferase [Pseudonocardia sp.]|nr:N-acetyltransferase [Pseudonocardia sp.]